MATIIEERETQEKKLERRKRPWEFPGERRNVGGAERGTRLMVGGASALAALAAADVWAKAALTLVAIAGVLTGAAGYCPVNRAAGRDSYHGR